MSLVHGSGVTAHHPGAEAEPQVADATAARPFPMPAGATELTTVFVSAGIASAKPAPESELVGRYADAFEHADVGPFRWPAPAATFHLCR